jgi:hypothetical protein
MTSEGTIEVSTRGTRNQYLRLVSKQKSSRINSLNTAPRLLTPRLKIASAYAQQSTCTAKWCTNREGLEVTVEYILKLLSANKGPKEGSSKFRALRSVHLLIHYDHGITASKHSAPFEVVKRTLYRVHGVLPSAAQICRLDSVPQVLGHG